MSSTRLSIHRMSKGKNELQIPNHKTNVYDEGFQRIELFVFST